MKVGSIDADYRGEVCVILGNIGREPFTVTRGMRIAQLVVARVARAEIVEVEVGWLPETERGAGGFGSTELGMLWRDRAGLSERRAWRPAMGWKEFQRLTELDRVPDMPVAEDDDL